MNFNQNAISEKQLVEALQPIRHFFLAQSIFHFLDSGLYDLISKSNGISINLLSTKFNLDSERLKGFLQYLANEGLTQIDESGNVVLTENGKRIEPFQPWYTLLVGGYAQSFLNLTDYLTKERKYAKRNSFQVGIGSCGISRFDALPMAKQLLEHIQNKWNTIVDIGCGDGRYLIELCASMPGINGIGIEPNSDSVERARSITKDYGLDDRIKFIVGSGTEVPDLSNNLGPFCFITAFVLQEILEQSGRNAILNLMGEMFDKYPNAHWIVIEVDHRPNDKTIMTHELGLAYYNPYYLIHQITEQRLETKVFWEELFKDVGLKVLATEYPNLLYDSLRLKIGFLLAKNFYLPLQIS